MRYNQDGWYLAMMATAILSVVVGVWVVKSHFEASAFNRVTGKSVTTWDAMWIELRVQGDGVTE